MYRAHRLPAGNAHSVSPYSGPAQVVRSRRAGTGGAEQAIADEMIVHDEGIKAIAKGKLE
jgi:hypothetical protein